MQGISGTCMGMAAQGDVLACRHLYVLVQQRNTVYMSVTS